jgi:hypothetical protein
VTIAFTRRCPTADAARKIELLRATTLEGLESKAPGAVLVLVRRPFDGWPGIYGVSVSTPACARCAAPYRRPPGTVGRQR